MSHKPSLFGSAANLSVHLHCLGLDGVYRCGDDGMPSFVEVDAPTDDDLHALLQTPITRLMKLLTRRPNPRGRRNGRNTIERMTPAGLQIARRRGMIAGPLRWCGGGRRLAR